MKKTAAAIIIVSMLLTLLGGVCFGAPPGSIQPGDTSYIDPLTGEESDSMTVTMEVDTEYRLLFTVLDAQTHQPIEGAVVNTVPENVDTVLMAVTDEKGHAGIKLPDPPDASGKGYVFVVTKVGYYDSEEVRVTYTGQFLQETVYLYRGDNLVYVDFEVTNDAGDPVAGAAVSVQPKDAATREAAADTPPGAVMAETNAKGQATVQVPLGNYTYLLQHETHQDTAGEISVVKNKRHTVPAVMQRNRYDVNVYVVDALGNAVADAVVTIKGQAVRTDGAGHALFTDLYAGSYDYKITKTGYGEGNGILRVPEDGDNVRLLLPDPAPLPTPTPVPAETPAPEGTDTAAPADTQIPAATPSASADNAGTYIPTEEVPMQSAVPIDLAVKVTYTNGEAAANLPLELHSKVHYGRTNNAGWEVFKSVEIGPHTIYVKDDDGNILASSEFELTYDETTDLQIGEDGTVHIVARVGLNTVIVEVEVDEETGKATVTAVREGTEDNLPKGVAGVDGTQLNLSKKIMGIDAMMWAMVLAIIVLGIVILVILILRKKKEEEQPPKEEQQATPGAGEEDS